MASQTSPNGLLIPDGLTAEDRRKLEVIDGMHDYAERQLGLLLSTEKAWQPTDFMPDFGQEGWEDRVRELQAAARELSDDLLVTLVGDMITEEALPSYQTMINRYLGVGDATGTSDTPWAKWTRAWTAEENRHGDLLNRFLYLSGRVDMRAIEVTIQNLISNGLDTETGNDPYKGFIYTSFQERATKISHRNVANLAKQAGDATLERICGVIAGDEARHEEAYKRFMDRIFEVDPDGAIRAFRDMMKRTIIMPARYMDDGREANLFDKFSAVAQRLRVYTAVDYADIIDHLVQRWKVATMSGLRDEAARAQDYLGNLAERYRKLAERLQDKMRPAPPMQFSWVGGRTV